MADRQAGRGLFALGGTGAIILVVASVVMAIVGLFPLWILNYSFVWYLILITGLVLLFIGSIFVGMAYYAFHRYFEHSMGIAGLIFGTTCSVAILIFAAIGMFPTVDGGSPSLFGLILYWLGLLLLGTMLVIWGVANLVVRKSTTIPGLSLAAGIMLIVAGCFVASFLLAFVGFVLLLATQIMNVIVFLKMAMASNQY
jgi:hypothetical protein